MRSAKEFPLWVLLGIPILLGLAFSFAPRPQSLQQDLQAAQMAQGSLNSTREATHFQGVLAWEPWRYSLWELTGNKAWEAGDAPAAITAFQTAEVLGALSEGGRKKLGDAYLAAGDWQQAIAAWQKLIGSKQMDFTSLYKQILAQQIDHKAFTDAFVTAQAWVIRDPFSAEAAFQAGLVEAAINPRDAIMYLNQSKILDSNLSAQVDFLQKAINTAYLETHAGYRRLVVGRALAGLGYWNLAAHSFELATQETPDYAEVWAFLGEALYQLGKDGTVELKKAQSIDSNSITVRALLALWSRRNNQIADAFTQLQEIARLQPEEVTWQIELGNTAALLGDLFAAYGYYQHSTELAKTDPQPWLALAEFSVVHQFQPREIGLPAARNALALTSNSAQALDLMGQVMVVLEDMDSAERFLQQAIQKDASYAAAHLHLGQFYLQEKQMDKAYPLLQQASQLAGKESDTGVLANRLLVRYFGGQ
jgi:tetratricopeptide (TPR) repeat protein